MPLVILTSQSIRDAHRPTRVGLSGLPKYGIRTLAGVFNERQQVGLFDVR